MQSGKKIIQEYQRRWHILQRTEVVLYAVSAVILGYVFFGFWVSIIVFAIVLGICIAIKKPWSLTEKKVSNHIDTHLKSAEYSSGLLLIDTSSMTSVAQLQQQKILQKLQVEISDVPTNTNVKRAIFILIAAIVIALLIKAFGITSNTFGNDPESQESKIEFTHSNTIESAAVPPVLLNAQLIVEYPEYTQLKAQRTSKMTITALEGTRFSWQLEFDKEVQSVVIEGLNNRDLVLSSEDKSKATTFKKSTTPTSSGYYNFKFTDASGASYTSDIYAITLVPDTAPVIEITGLDPFTSFEYSDTKELSFTTELTDDYGLESAHIIATVSKGEGESVKFREERLSFDQVVERGEKDVTLSRKLKLDDLKMEIGDELYFYVEAIDQKQPKPNISRSETFFAVIKDTVTDGFAVEGTLGADLMPDYFRSQRQLIIDTKKLIAEKATISDSEFRSRSNDLGSDQKSLRLKYGQFMGDEEDSGLAIDREVPEGVFDEEDPTAGYRHDHDTENEHNLVEEKEGHHDDHEEHQDEEKSPLEDYLHNHGDPEESTLFTASLRSKLKEAMAQMWDSELHLRLAAPEKSLPYQYKALELIQEIKNSARIYVHRIGFDPPPIKEDKRLTGDLDEVGNVFKKDDTTFEDAYYFMRLSISMLEDRLDTNTEIIDQDRVTLSKAGKELALLAIKEPSKYLETLQQLKRLTEEKQQPSEVLQSVRKGLLSAVPEMEANAFKKQTYNNTLQMLTIKELQKDD